MEVLLVAVKNEILYSFRDAIEKAGLEPGVTFANLHWIFGGVLLASTAVYLLAPARPPAA